MKHFLSQCDWAFVSRWNYCKAWCSKSFVFRWRNKFFSELVLEVWKKFQIQKVTPSRYHPQWLHFWRIQFNSFSITFYVRSQKSERFGRFHRANFVYASNFNFRSHWRIKKWKFQEIRFPLEAVVSHSQISVKDITSVRFYIRLCPRRVIRLPSPREVILNLHSTLVIFPSEPRYSNLVCHVF